MVFGLSRSRSAFITRPTDRGVDSDPQREALSVSCKLHPLPLACGVPLTAPRYTQPSTPPSRGGGFFCIRPPLLSQIFTSLRRGASSWSDLRTCRSDITKGQRQPPQSAPFEAGTVFGATIRGGSDGKAMAPARATTADVIIPSAPWPSLPVRSNKSRQIELATATSAAIAIEARSFWFSVMV